MNRALLALENAWHEKKNHNPVETRKNGPNNEPRIRYYLTRAGVRIAAPWCAAFVNNNCLEAGFKPSELPLRPAGVWSWVDWARTIGVHTNDPSKVVRGDLFCWLKKGLGHIGHIAESKYVKFPGVYKTADGSRKVFALPGWYIRTWEGNANQDPESREGVEIAHRWRHVKPNFMFILLTKRG